VGSGIDALLGKLTLIIKEKESSPGREAMRAAVNGVLGDYLVDKENPLAIPMQLRKNGKPMAMEIQTLSKLIRQSNGKIVLMVHGSCMNDSQWNRQEHDHGTALASDFGYPPVYLHYNTGRHISENGRECANLLETFFNQLPGPIELIIIAHSMGGLVSRSAGITDLRYGNILDEDWKGRDRFGYSGDGRIPVPLPNNVQCYTIAAITGKKSSKLGDDLIGDGLVTLNSALGRHKNPDLNLLFPETHQWIGRNMNHLDLLNHSDIYETIKKWLKT